jgi:hypothetical protein
MMWNQEIGKTCEVVMNGGVKKSQEGAIKEGQDISGHVGFVGNL